MARKFLEAPEGFKILKDMESDFTTYKFVLDRQYMYRVSTEDLMLSETWMEQQVIDAGMHALVKDLERCIAEYKKSLLKGETN